MPVDFNAVNLFYYDKVNPTTIHMPVEYENVSQRGTAEANELDEAKSNAPDTRWARLTMRPGSGQSLSIGRNRVVRYNGSALITVFTPANRGSNLLLETFNILENILQNSGVGDIMIRDSDSNILGKDPQNWFYGVFTSNYEYNQILD